MNESQSVFDLFQKFCYQLSLEELSGNSKLMTRLEILERELLYPKNLTSRHIKKRRASKARSLIKSISKIERAQNKKIIQYGHSLIKEIETGLNNCPLSIEKTVRPPLTM